MHCKMVSLSALIARAMANEQVDSRKHKAQIPPYKRDVVGINKALPAIEESLMDS